jgi:Cu/Zn superoxide dismutase
MSEREAASKSQNQRIKQNHFHQIPDSWNPHTGSLPEITNRQVKKAEEKVLQPTESLY